MELERNKDIYIYRSSSATIDYSEQNYSEIYRKGFQIIRTFVCFKMLKPFSIDESCT